ncbi:MAG TPA: hypothetical protein VI076_06145 [Actinopolymorphaceae bacterium]
MSDASLMSSLGYALALGGPIAVTALVVVACVKRKPIGWMLAPLLALAFVGLGSNVTEFVGFAGNVVAGFGTFAPRIGWAWATAAMAGGWAFVALRAHDASWMSARFAGRWGRIATASIGIGAILGATLTLGLISRWGEVFPRWVPIVHGRPVPVPLAVVPGAVVASAATIGGPGPLVSSFEESDPGHAALALLLFPFPIWGPLLGAAVLAYWLRRARAPVAPGVATGGPTRTRRGHGVSSRTRVPRGSGGAA